MALVKYGAIVAEARGKEGGIVFSRNRGGAYIKVKVTPTNPQTLFQQIQRGALASISQAWRGLSQANRDSWKAFALQLPITNIFGDQTYLSGFGAFVKCNRNLRLLGLANISTPGAIPAFGQFTSLTIAATLGAVTATWVIVGGSGFARFVYDLTPGITSGKTYVKNLYRMVLAEPAAPVSPKVLTTQYVARFGVVPIAGQRISLRLRQIDNVSGWDTYPIEVTAIAT